MKVPFLDFAAPYRQPQAELDAAYRRLKESGWYMLASTCTQTILCEYLLALSGSCVPDDAVQVLVPGFLPDTHRVIPPANVRTVALDRILQLKTMIINIFL